jgi:hypothetical protein
MGLVCLAALPYRSRLPKNGASKLHIDCHDNEKCALNGIVCCRTHTQCARSNGSAPSTERSTKKTIATAEVVNIVDLRTTRTCIQKTLRRVANPTRALKGGSEQPTSFANGPEVKESSVAREGQSCNAAMQHSSIRARRQEVKVRTL